jgi:hypothetical protein
MTLIVARRGRKLTRDITMTDASSNTVTPGGNDVVRVKIGRPGSAPVLDLDSAAASANGSTVTKNNTPGVNRLAVVESDMNLFSTGVYTAEVALVDNADGGAIKHVEHQVFVVQPVMLGDVGLT